jgi:hypothetical protein
MTSLEVFKDIMPMDRLMSIMTASKRTSICEELTDRLIITESRASARVPIPFGSVGGFSYELMLEKDVMPMNEYVSE